MQAQTVPVTLGLIPLPFAVMFFVLGERDSGPSYLPPCMRLGCLWRRLGLANRSGLTASICCRSLKSSPRSSSFSRPATTTASRRRTSLWNGSTAWRGSARPRGERGPGLCCCRCIKRCHRSSPPAPEQLLPRAPLPALPPSPCRHGARRSRGGTESSNLHLSLPSYGLSCEIEPLSESASNTLKAKKNTGIIKRWSE